MSYTLKRIYPNSVAQAGKFITYANESAAYIQGEATPFSLT
jgi:hypothetical protein